MQVKSDFVVHGAGSEECAARIRQLLWPGNESTSTDYVTVDNMTINLATVSGNRWAGSRSTSRTSNTRCWRFWSRIRAARYSRDALLRRVWGFDYYGGSRTVDVHVRRVRAKLGPELSQHLETVRGVGYLWSA